MYSIFQLKATLKNSKPPIWRRFMVPSTISLAELHIILQILFSWEDCHLHQFTIDEIDYGVPDPEEDSFWGDEIIDESKVRLSRVVNKEGQKLDYWYDFGDNWHHDIIVEKIISGVLPIKSAVCIAGKLAAPPDDVGGIWGYYSFLEIINDPKHEQHAEMLDWIGGEFNPETFDIEQINKQLKKLKL